MPSARAVDRLMTSSNLVDCVTGKSYLCFTDEYARLPGGAPRLSRNGQAVQQFVGLGGFASHLLVGQNMVVRRRFRIAEFK